jgi:alkanesulfonate monooxygenase SsuD/methylene tetrahydromethanopterin reductase-like flavin-dependent oxidoreductase (luciferase family)
MLFGAMDHLDISDHCPIAEHYENRLKLLELYDAFGFYGFHTTEHHCTPLGGGASPSVFLAAAAQRTKTLRLGTLVYVLPAYHPIRLVEEIGMLDQLSNGRLDLGFGRGSVPMELAYLGIDPGDARAIYEEALQCIIQGLRDQRIDFHGKYFDIKDAPIFQRPLQRPLPPIWYGVHSVESAEKAAERGFNIVCNEPSEDSAVYIARFKEVWKRVRPGEPTAKIGLARFVVVGATDHDATVVANRAYSVFFKSFRFLHTRHGVVPRLSGRESTYSELEASGRGVAGAPDRVVRILGEQLTQAGADYCIMRMAFGDMRFAEMSESVALFAKQVAPALREQSDRQIFETA